MSAVLESSQEERKVASTERTISPVSTRARSSEEPATCPTTTNIAINEIRVEKRPLQGIRLLVSTAISRSRGESMMRQPVTPTALHPSPMHMVSACLPQELAFWKQWSRLKATRGR